MIPQKTRRKTGNFDGYFRPGFVTLVREREATSQKVVSYFEKSGCFTNQKESGRANLNKEKHFPNHAHHIKLNLWSWPFFSMSPLGFPHPSALEIYACICMKVFFL